MHKDFIQFKVLVNIVDFPTTTDLRTTQLYNQIWTGNVKNQINFLMIGALIYQADGRCIHTLWDPTTPTGIYCFDLFFY